MFLLLVALSASAAPLTNSGSLSVGYREKDITFGNISSRQGAVYTNVDLRLQSFHFAVNAANNMSLKETSMYQTDVLVGYKLFSSLADVEFGGTQVFKGKPVVTDMAQHFRPFVALSKGFVTLTGKMDLEAKTTNVQLDLNQSTSLIGDLTGKLSGFVGYTDVNDARPRSLKEIKYTNAYYGGALDFSWKVLGAGVYVLRSGHTNDTTFGWRTQLTLKF